MDLTAATVRWPWLFAAWLIALVSSLTVLFVGEVMGQVPCNLCWFQRAFMFPLAVMLAVACLRSDATVVAHALPLAAIGAAIASFHTLLYVGVIPQSIQPCGEGPSCTSADMTLAGLLPLPALALMAFVAIAGALILGRARAPASTTA